MGKQELLLEVDPHFLPLGARVGPWRVTGFLGRGACGTLYRVEHVGREPVGPFALKLALCPRDPRFEHEAQLLSLIHSPHVPQLMDDGVWEHPSGSHPFLVMQFRDVKGDNVVVRGADLWAFLTDFGAGHFRGAATLTSRLLPPGTPAYRSPEAVAFVHAFRRHPTAHYPASTCDDLFALGVMAYRLVTDEYPPSPQQEGPGSEVWREGGPGPRPVRELNPCVSPELEALISRLLAWAPEERFNGQARLAAEALEQLAQRAHSFACARCGGRPQNAWCRAPSSRAAPEAHAPAASRLGEPPGQACTLRGAARPLHRRTARVDPSAALLGPSAPAHHPQ